MTFATRFAVVSLLLVPGFATGQTPEPAKKPPVKRPSIYDAQADAKVQVEKATALAKRDSKRVLVMFGGDWCGWCHKLHDLFKSDPAIRKTLSDEYVLVMVDTKAPNVDPLFAACKGDLESVGYPFLAVLDDSGKVVTRQKTDPLEEGDHHDPKKVKAFLDQWTAPKQVAQAVFDNALARAKSEDKMVFLHFGAPWCGWCHHLEAFLAKPETIAILGKDFIDLKIDEDRMIGGKELDAKFRKNGEGGIPWIAFLDAQGKVLATSDGAKGNIGYPAAPHEIAHFTSMLRKTARRIEPAQIEALQKALTDANAQIESASRLRPIAAPAAK
jgi:thioredoxin-related protein